MTALVMIMSLSCLFKVKMQVAIFLNPMKTFEAAKRPSKGKKKTTTIYHKQRLNSDQNTWLEIFFAIRGPVLNL